MPESKSESEQHGHLAPAASKGFKNAAAYDAHRPAYPSEAVDKLLEKMRLLSLAGEDGGDDEGGPVRIVEIAAGTGKFTEALVGAFSRRQRQQSGEGGEEKVVEVLATEPHPDMLKELEGKKLEGVTVRKGGAEELGRVVFGGEEGDEKGEGWADGVIAAQAFHW